MCSSFVEHGATLPCWHPGVVFLHFLQVVCPVCSSVYCGEWFNVKSIFVSPDEQAQLLLDHTCNSQQFFNMRGIRQARWSAFAAGRNRWSCVLGRMLFICLLLFDLHEMLLYFYVKLPIYVRRQTGRHPFDSLFSRTAWVSWHLKG